MQNLTLHVTYTTKPGMRKSFIQEISDSGILEKIRRERGCLEYSYYLSLENENEVLLLEKWDTETHQQDHLKQPHMEILKAMKDRYVIHTRLEKLP